MILLILSGCNSLRCEFTHPDKMSEELLEYCKAAASAPNINSYNY